MSKATETEALATLRKLLPPGSRVYVAVQHVSRSGMMRRLTACVVDDGALFNIDHLIAQAGIARRHRDGGIVMNGAGMDMTFALVYNISRALYADGYKCSGSTGWTPTGKRSKLVRCESNDHSNGVPVKKGTHHRDGGYALRREHF